VALSNTAYDDQGKPPCDEDTRVEILAVINRWVDDISSGSQNFFWLTGDPGCGKSAITASLARYCKDSGTLWAQFFINRNTEATTNPRFYFPSIARQMAEHTTSDQTITKTIYDIVKRRPSVLDQITLSQALGLFVETVQAACDLDPSKPVAIVIDGLDETRRNKLQDTAEIFSQLFKVLNRRNAKVFISSRTDDEITKPFYLALRSTERHVKHFHLDTSNLSCIEDVSRYLFRNVKLLVEKWDLNWEEWPGEERMKVLCVRAGGLFIWAVTVVKFFQEQLRQSEHERLNVLLDVINDEGMGDVNHLYGKILEITYTVKTNTRAQNDWEHAKFRWIVGFIVMMKEPLPVGDIAALLDLRQTPQSNPVNVVHFVTNLRTVLVSGSGIISNETIPRLHKSFVEFITSERADPQFRIDAPVVDGQIATKCLRLVRRLKIAGEKASLPEGSVRYAIHNWVGHLSGYGNSESGIGVVGGDEGIEKVLLKTTELELRNKWMSATGDYRTHMYDPKIGLPLPATALVTPPQYIHRSTIQGGDEIFALAMSPDGKLFASGTYYNGAVQIWDSRLHYPVGDAGSHECVTSLCFSPDSRWLVSGSFDKTLRMWDCGTGLAIGPPLLGHTSYVSSVCTDGEIIISGSGDETIRIWSCDTHELIGAPIHVGGNVSAVALSNDGHIGAGVGCDVLTFHVETRRHVALMKGHTKSVLTVAFSPDNSRIASGSSDKMICIWDVQTGILKQSHEGYEGDVTSVAYSLDGEWIASGSEDKTIRIWESQTGRLVCLPLKGHTDLVGCLSFSPDTFQLISGSFDRTIRIWSALAKWQKPSQQITTIYLSRYPAFSPNRISLAGHPSVISACCSADGSLYAASTLDGHISIWNVDRKLLWEMDTLFHPIHLLRFSDAQLVLSTLDGSTSSWNLLDGKPTDEAITHGPQLDASVRRPIGLSNDTVFWSPFDFDAGLWAYVDGCLIRFEGGGTITFFDLQDFS